VAACKRTGVDVLKRAVQLSHVPTIKEFQSRSSSLPLILAELRSVLPTLRAKYGVVRLSVFGSAVRDEMDSDSDIDLLVEFERAPGFFMFVKIEDELSELLQRKVDLVMKQALRPRIGRRVLAEAMSV
jgi:predicted nucleotidyltransferase